MFACHLQVIFPFSHFFFPIHTMKYTKIMFEVIILDSYRAYNCGRCRNMNPRGTNNAYSYQNRCVMPNESRCKEPVMPECKCVSPEPYTPPVSCDCASNSTANCDCNDTNRHMQHMPIGIGYVPIQKWEEMYDPKTALCQGTAFPSLNLIFCGIRG